MRTHATTILGLLSLVLAACGPGPRPADQDPNEACKADLGQSAAICQDGCTDLMTDPLNCGTCGHDCSMPHANACVEGMCACLGSNHVVADECDDPTVCAEQVGLCVIPDYGTTEKCDPIDGIACADPHKVCVGGYCTQPDCNHPEVCDGLDNDCDGHVDATGPVPGPPTPLSRSCYDGDPALIGVGICQAGQQLCYVGNWTPQNGCTGEVLPGTETGLLDCDGLDNDCNGCVDDHEENGAIVCGTPMQKKTDVTFMIDNSGSMYDKINAVIASIGSFSTTYQAAPWIRWGIERISWPEPVLVDVRQALTSFPAFYTTLSAFTALQGGGTEPQYDAAYLTATGYFDASLQPAASAQQVYVIFTDEDAQTLLSLDEHATCQAVQARGAILVVFTLPEFYYEWDECAILYPLSADAADMTSHLDDLFQLVCTM